MITSPRLELYLDFELGHKFVRVALQSVELLTQNQVDALRQQWTSVARAFDWGLLTDPSVDPGKAAGAIVNYAMVADRKITIELELCGASASSWKIVLNLMHALSDCTVALDSISVASVPPPTRPTDVGAVLSAPYPAPRPVPFPIYRIEGEARRDRFCEVHFKRPLTAAQRIVVEEAFLSWMDLANGGFPESGKPPLDNACDATEVSWPEDEIASCVSPNYLGDEAAFDVVVNLAASLNAKLAPVALLQIR